MGCGGAHQARRRYRWKQPPCRSPSQQREVGRGEQVKLSATSTARAQKSQRAQSGSRVQSYGIRIQCSASRVLALKRRLEEERAKRDAWTAGRWKLTALKISKEGWGAATHGGKRKGRAGSAEATAGPPAAGPTPSGAREGEGELGHSAVGESKLPVAVLPLQPASEGRAEENSAVGESDMLPAVLPPALESHKKLSGYSVIEIINSGSYGDVYKAEKKGSGELFAVKVMTKTTRTAVLSLAQERELALMKSLRNTHPSIISLLGWRETAFNVQLFMPLYEMTLRQHIRQASVPEDQGKAISLQMCSAVAFLHHSCILHRDIKPPNILMKCQPLAAVLSDFGCSREVLPATSSGSRDQPLTPNMVTLWYRAPEIFLQEGSYDLPSDVWSLGITLAEVEAGRAPFEHSSELTMLSGIFQILGCPASVKSNSRMALLGDAVQKSGYCRRSWGNRYRTEFRQLIDAMLVVQPSHRISAHQASRHAFFAEAKQLVAKPLAGEP